MKPNKIRQLANATAILSMVFAFIACPLELRAAERIYTAYFSPAPGASAVIWVAKEARLFDKYGLDVAVEALREGWREKKFTMNELTKAAAVCRVGRVIQPYLEMLT